MNCSSEALGRHTLPLCRRYILVRFELTAVRIHQSRAQREEFAHWALAEHPDGGREVVGVWLATERHASWSRIAQDLRARGVEQIDSLEGLSEPGATSRAAIGERRSGGVLPSIGMVPRSTARLARASRSTRGATTELSARLKRSVARHGPFGSRELAEHFLKRILWRFEAQLWRSMP